MPGQDLGFVLDPQQCGQIKEEKPVKGNKNKNKNKNKHPDKNMTEAKVQLFFSRAFYLKNEVL